MTRSDLASRAARFKALNDAGGLRLPNAWDAASARLFQSAGFPAIGTTSAGIAWSHGMLDAELITRDAMMREIAAIADAVDVPVTADIEAGYGPSPLDVAATVEATLDAGAVGINLEDNTNSGAAADGGVAAVQHRSAGRAHRRRARGGRRARDRHGDQRPHRSISDGPWRR